MQIISFTIIEKVLIATSILMAFGSFIYELRHRLRIILKGSGSLPTDHFILRSIRFIREVLLHEKVIKYRPLVGIMHALVFWGFIVFGIITIDHFALGLGIQ